MSMQKTEIIGNIGQIRPLSYLASGDAVLNITVAVNVGKKDDNKPPVWFDCDLWRQQAELVGEYSQVGDEIYLEGTVELSTYPKKDGSGMASKLELHVRNVTLLRNGRSAGSQEPGPTPAAAPKNDNLSDIPF